MRLRNRASGALSAPVTLAYTVAGGFAHGEQVVRGSVGPVGPLTAVAGFNTTADGAVYDNLEIVGGLGVRHHTTLRNCRIVGSPSAGSAGYTVKHVQGTGKRLVLEDCEVLTRSAVTKGLVMYGNGGLYAARTAFRGGTDNVYCKPAGAHFEGFAGVLRECWFGDVQRYTGSHSDCVQVDGSAGGLLLERVRIESYSLPVGADPLTAQADGSQLASGGLILTQNSSNPDQIARVHVVDSWVEGGNYTVDTAPPDGLTPLDCRIEGNRFGLAHRYGPLRYGAGTAASANTWGATGTTGTGLAVVAGEPVG